MDFLYILLSFSSSSSSEVVPISFDVVMIDQEILTIKQGKQLVLIYEKFL